MIEENRRRLEQAAAADVRDAMASHAVAGVADVWAAANAGRGRRLVVEDGYRFPARVLNGSLEATPDGEAGSFDAVDDAVAAVIRDGGDVVAVPAGDLADVGRIALVTRF